jgi:predicted  nucleic acid-binding Zn-ribbon protein
MSEKELQRALHMTGIGIKIFETQLSAIKARLAELECQNADLQAAQQEPAKKCDRPAENTVVLKIQFDATKALEDIASVQERLKELEAYRSAAVPRMVPGDGRGH